MKVILEWVNIKDEKLNAKDFLISTIWDNRRRMDVKINKEILIKKLKIFDK